MKKIVLPIIILVVFFVGFFAGMEYKAYQIRSIFTDTITQPQENDVAVEQKTDIKEEAKTEFQKLLDEKTIINKNLGDTLELATVNVTVKSVEEKNIFNRDYGQPLVARENAKYIVVNMEVVNTTSEAFDFAGGDIRLVDSKERVYSPSDDIYSSDGSLIYREISPNLQEVGILLYEIPTDSENYAIYFGKAGTNEVYKVILK